MIDSIVLDRKSQESLWQHMFKKSVVRLGSAEEFRARSEILAHLVTELKTGAYSPRPVHGFLSAPKGNGVARFVPVLTYQDVCVYFGCVKAFDEKLSSLAVPDTFGGWSLGGKRRSREEDQAVDAISASMPVSAYNRWAWVANWQQFWKLLAARFEHLPDDSCFVMFDIANFYDTVDLPRLERMLRRECGDKHDAIQVLIYFLSNWNKRLNEYAQTSKGIPQDIFGDNSRALANFYLTPFDKRMRESSLRDGSTFMRFADDMVLACPDSGTCRKLVYFASKELNAIGLNINVAKVKYLTKSEFDCWWGFSIMDGFENRDDESALRQLKEFEQDRAGFGRWHTALTRAVGLLSKRGDMRYWKDWLYETVTGDEDTVLSLKEAQMGNLIRLSRDIHGAIGILSTVILKSSYSQPKACLLRCLEEYRGHKDSEVRSLVSSVVSRIKGLSDPVLDLALNNMPEIKHKHTLRRPIRRLPSPIRDLPLPVETARTG